MINIAIIVGARGQDGTLLRISLKKKGFHVLGISNGHFLDYSMPSVKSTDLFSVLNSAQVISLIKSSRPNYVYYLAAHHVSSEQNRSDNTSDDYNPYHQVHVIGLLNFLCAIRDHSPSTRLFYAASSLIYDGTHGPIQNEETPFTPVDFYGLTKAQGILTCRDFRKRYDIYASCGILYNHESALRPDKFLSKKLISAAHQITLGKRHELILGNLQAESDWGYAPDYVEAFQHVLGLNIPDDYIIATGETHSVEEFARIVFNCFALDSLNYVRECPHILNRRLPRKLGDFTKLRCDTGWQPTYDFSNMVKTLVSDYLSMNESSKMYG